jgi:single-strand DNA-binding protein
MNKVILVGRLVRAPEIRTTQSGTTIASYSLAVDRRRSSDGEKSADFINCKAFGKNAENTEKYLKKGMKIGVIGRIQTGSYENNEGKRVYTTDVIVDEQEFMESKRATAENETSSTASYSSTASEDTSFFFEPTDSDDDTLPF